MTATPYSTVKRLEKEELELALALTASAGGFDDPKCEAWGITPGRPPAKVDAVWGLFIQDSLAGAAWTFSQSNKTVVTSMFIPKGRWGSGMLGVFLDGIAEQTASREIRIKLATGGPALGEALQDAGFAGPDIGAENYPVGEWIRAAR